MTCGLGQFVPIQQYPIMSNFNVIVSLTVSMFIASGTAQAVTYKFTDLGSLSGYHSKALDINNSGTIVGYAETLGAGGPVHAVVWNNGIAKDLGTLGGTRSMAYSINGDGTIVGWADTGNTQTAALWESSGQIHNLGTPVGYAGQSAATSISDGGQVVGYAYNTGGNASIAILWNNGQNLGTLGGQGNAANAISNSGVVVGYSQLVNGEVRAVRWNDGQNLGTLGGVWSEAYGINSYGQVVGSSDTARVNGQQHATLWSGNTVTDLGALQSGSISAANGINDAGQVVGYSIIAAGKSHATLWQDGNVIDLNSFLSASDINAGWVLNNANAINDKGWIVGEAQNSVTGQSHAYVLSVTAVPEPESYALALVSLGAIGLSARRSKKA